MQPTIIRGAEQSDIWLLTDHLKPLLRGEHAENRLTILLSRLHPNGGPPPHLHERDDEAFYILEGEVTFLAGDRRVRASAGQFVWAPRNIVHNFQCTSPTPANMILIVTPADFMNFAMTLSEAAPDFAAVPTLTPEKIGQLMSVAPNFGIRMLPEHPIPAAVVSAADASKRLWVMGEKVSFLATAEQTGGMFTVVEIITAPQGGPPAHVHGREDEIFYVIAGRHEVQLGERRDVAGPGDLVFIPRGTRHRYSCVDADGGKLLSIHTPGGFEAFFEEVGVDAAEHAVARKFSPPSPEVMKALLERHGMTV